MLRSLFSSLLPQPSHQAVSTGTQVLTLHLSGLHCTSCALVIDDALEEMEGVHASTTHYAHSYVTVTYDTHKTDSKTIQERITSLGYTITRTIP